MSYFIYKLCCDDCDDFYVGSTKSIKDRKHEHSKKSKTNPTLKYRVIRQYGGWENWRMVVIEECAESIQTKRQAEMREEEHRLQLKATMNTNRAYQTVEQRKEQKREASTNYRLKYPERKAHSAHTYYEKNKIDILDQRKQQYTADPEHYNAISRTYYEENKERILESKKVKYSKNKEHILAKYREKVICECGCEVTWGHIARHQRTKKHQDLILNKNVNK